ncbi:AraC family transcriptional regulator [Aureimonas flava]|uniref:AraC family transcriptional regulator n=1 Tax=Aureimonas flava TaxID=2320271 RepID=UPI00145A0316|nr:AraC family transcriptional regulator [Aureimonas flava]
MITSDDFEKLTEAADTPHVIRPLGLRTPEFDLSGVCVPDLAIWTVASPTGLESVPVAVRDAFTIRIPLDGGLVVRSAGHEREVPVGSASILQSQETLATRFEPGAHVLCCAVGMRELAIRREALEGERAPFVRFQPTVKLEGPRLNALVHTIRQIGAHMGSMADMLTGPLLVDLLLNQILSAWPSDSSDASSNAAAVVARGVDYIEAHLGEALTVGSVAAAARVSVRTLQSAFRAHTGRTPLGYILDRRMERAHADLLANGGRLAVSQIAYRWGFLHMGEFSRRYRQRYGCTPSQTSRRVA